jgi:putative NADH-flavin reductase
LTLLTVLLIGYVLYAIILNIGLGRTGLPLRTPPPPRGDPRAPISKVLIVGATGGTGRQLVQQALDRGLAVTALCHHAGKLGISHPQLTEVVGDVLDQQTVESAVEGQHAVLCALGHKRWFGPSSILSNGTWHLIGAMERHRVPRFVCETSLGIGHSAFRLGLYYTLFVIPIILPFYYWDKTLQEIEISESSLQWIVVRPGALTDGPARGRVTHGEKVGSFILTRRIPRADVAAFMLDQLTSDEYLRRAPGVV